MVWNTLADSMHAPERADSIASEEKKPKADPFYWEHRYTDSVFRAASLKAWRKSRDSLMKATNIPRPANY